MDNNERPIVLIDDDPEDLDLIREVVKEMKCLNPVVSFTDPVKALDYFKTDSQLPPFFILCDLNMPKLNGLQLRKEMMVLEGYDPKIPFYLLSTGNTSREREVTTDLNVSDYLVKASSYAGIKSALETIVLNATKMIE